MRPICATQFTLVHTILKLSMAELLISPAVRIPLTCNRLKHTRRRSFVSPEALSTSGYLRTVTQAASVNQNVTYATPCEKPEECPPCLAHKLKGRNRAGKEKGILNKTLKISDGALSLMTESVSCSEMRQTATLATGTVTHGSQIESSWERYNARWGFELRQRGTGQSSSPV